MFATSAVLVIGLAFKIAAALFWALLIGILLGSFAVGFRHWF